MIPQSIVIFQRPPIRVKDARNGTTVQYRWILCNIIVSCFTSLLLHTTVFAVEIDTLWSRSNAEKPYTSSSSSSSYCCLCYCCCCCCSPSPLLVSGIICKLSYSTAPNAQGIERGQHVVAVGRHPYTARQGDTLPSSTPPSAWAKILLPSHNYARSIRKMTLQLFTYVQYLQSSCLGSTCR